MANHRAGVPAGWTWRDARPRWIPSPTLRKAGWRGADLKGGKGAWLARGASIDAAERINAAITLWRAGQLAPAHVRDFAPDGACETPGAGLPRPAADRRSIGYLLDAYLGAPERGVAPSREFEKIKNKADRRSKLSRLQDVLAGYPLKPAPDATPKALAAYAAARERVRGLNIDTLEPPDFDDQPDLSEAQGPLYDVYWTLKEKVGPNMAHGVLGEASTWLEWCVKRRAVRANWARLVDREAPPGRIRVGTWEELRALIKAAERQGLHSIADSIILGVDLSWSQADRLKLKWPQIGKDGRVKGTRQKTGRKGETPLLDGLGKPRVATIARRQKELYGENVQMSHVLICELTGKPWSSSYYRDKFAEVRAEAAKDCPSVATLMDLDLRDTAITVAYAAGLNPPEIASRSLHSLKRITDVLDKHYAELGQEIADAGADKLNDYLTKHGIAL